MLHRLLDSLLFHQTRFGQRRESNPVMRAQMSHEEEKVLLAHLARARPLLTDYSDPARQLALEAKRVAEASPVAELQETPCESADGRVGHQGFAGREERRENALIGVAEEKKRRVVVVRPNCDGEGRGGGNHRGETIQLESVLLTGGEERGRGGRRSLLERNRVECVVPIGIERGRVLRMRAW